jgi:hypothetical protein
MTKLKTVYICVNANYALEVLARVFVGNVADDSEVNAASTSRVDV